MKRKNKEGELVIDCAGERLFLHSQRAIYRPTTRTLLVADVHFGKESAFGRAGLAVPHGINASNLLRLSKLLTHYNPKQLMILGDFMHAAPEKGDAWTTEFRLWLKRYPKLKISVIVGNHDRARSQDTIAPRIQWLKEPYAAPPFAYAHLPVVHDSLFTLAGHIHPTFLLGTRGDRIRNPVFWFQLNMAILPAFGTFTGGCNVTRNRGDRIFLIGPGEILEIPSIRNRDFQED